VSSNSDFNSNVVDEFRANGGKVGGYFEGRPMMILTSIGAKSGKQRVHPLVYTTDGDDYVIIASKGGADTNPDWYHNLLANPVATVEVGTERFQVRSRLTAGAERRRLYDAQSALMPGFAEYEQKTTREIPLFVLSRID
jgi:deazaflavin-dependent oxidoreductase (nitroreductase family)